MEYLFVIWGPFDTRANSRPVFSGMVLELLCEYGTVPGFRVWVRRFFEVMGWTGGKGLFVCLLAWLLERGPYWR